MSQSGGGSGGGNGRGGGSGDSEDGRVRCTPTKCRQYARIFLANLFSHVGLCGLVVGYAIVGALTFEALEAKHEVRQRNEIQQYRDKCLNDLWQITLEFNILYEENWTSVIGRRLRDFEQAVVTAVKNEGYDGKDTQDHELQWSFSGALLYSVTVITTIGYGNIAPKTATGKVVTILYALLGVPLMLLCLTNIGDLLAHAFKFAYSKVCCVLCRDKRKYVRSQRSVHCDSVKYVAAAQSCGGKIPLTAVHVDMMSDHEGCESDNANNSIDKRHLQMALHHQQQQQQAPPASPNSILKHGGVVGSDVATNEHHQQQGEPESVSIERMPQHMMGDAGGSGTEARVPIYLVLAFVSGYICLGAMIFSLWEDWTFLNGAYFCFITLSTIGFGDLVPGTSILDTRSETGQAKLIICCFYLILGLSIIAMSFNLVQEEVTAKCKQIGRNLGILDDDDNDD